MRSTSMLDWVADWVEHGGRTARQADEVRGARWPVLSAASMQRSRASARGPGDSRASARAHGQPHARRAPPARAHALLHRRRRRRRRGRRAHDAVRDSRFERRTLSSGARAGDGRSTSARSRDAAPVRDDRRRRAATPRRRAPKRRSPPRSATTPGCSASAPGARRRRTSSSSTAAPSPR